MIEVARRRDEAHGVTDAPRVAGIRVRAVSGIDVEEHHLAGLEFDVFRHRFIILIDVQGFRNLVSGILAAIVRAQLPIVV